MQSIVHWGGVHTASKLLLQKIQTFITVTLFHYVSGKDIQLDCSLQKGL